MEDQTMMEQQRKHEIFQEKNLGGFTKIYPMVSGRPIPTEDEEQEIEEADTEMKPDNLSDLYTAIKEHSIELQSNQFGVRKTKTQLTETKSPNPKSLTEEQFSPKQGNNLMPKFVQTVSGQIVGIDGQQ